VLVPQAALAGQPDIPLDRPVTTVGSNEQSRLHLVSRTVSKGHALFVNSGGLTYVADMASRTGVLVNGKLVKDADLRTGDRVQIGKFLFRYRSPANTTPPPPQPDPPAAAVIVVGSPAVPVTRRTVVIGRRETCDIAIPNDAGVSAGHAVIFQLDGHWFLRDLASRTGTTVNGKAIHQQQLNFGDRIAIGSASILFQPGAVQVDALEDSGIVQISHEAPIDLEQDIERLPEIPVEEVTAPVGEQLLDWKTAFPSSDTEEPVAEDAAPVAADELARIPLDDLDDLADAKASPSTNGDVAHEPEVHAVDPSHDTLSPAEADFDFLADEPAHPQETAPPPQAVAPPLPAEGVEEINLDEALAAQEDLQAQPEPALGEDFDFLSDEPQLAEASATQPPEQESKPPEQGEQSLQAESIPSARPVPLDDAPLDLDAIVFADEVPPVAQAPAASEPTPIESLPVAVDELDLVTPEIEPALVSPEVHAVSPAPEIAEPVPPPVAESAVPLAVEPEPTAVAPELAATKPDQAATENVLVAVVEPLPVEPVAAAATAADVPPAPVASPPVGITPPVVAKELLEAVDDFVFVPTDSGAGDADVIFWGDDTVSAAPPPPPPPPPPSPPTDHSSDHDDEPPAGGGPPDPAPSPIAPPPSGRSAPEPAADPARNNGHNHSAATDDDGLIQFADASEPIAQASAFRIDADNWTVPQAPVFEPVPDIHIPEVELHSLEDDYAIPMSESLGAAFGAMDSWLATSSTATLSPVMELSEEALTDAISLVPEIDWSATINTPAEPEPEAGVTETSPAEMESTDPAAGVASATPENANLPIDFAGVVNAELPSAVEIETPSPALEAGPIEATPAATESTDPAAGVASATPDHTELPIDLLATVQSAASAAPVFLAEALSPVAVASSAAGALESAIDLAGAVGTNLTPQHETIADQIDPATDPHLNTESSEPQDEFPALDFDAPPQHDAAETAPATDVAGTVNQAMPAEVEPDDWGLTFEDEIAEPPPTPTESTDPAAGVASATPSIGEPILDEVQALSQESPIDSAHESLLDPEAAADDLLFLDEPSGFEILPESADFASSEIDSTQHIEEVAPAVTPEVAETFESPTLTSTPATTDFTAVSDSGAIQEPPREETITLSEEWAAPVDSISAQSDLDLLELADEPPASAESPAEPAIGESQTPTEPPALAEPQGEPQAESQAEPESKSTEPAPAVPEAPAVPPAPERRGPSLFGFDFGGGSFLGGMPISLTGPTPPAPPIPAIPIPSSAPVASPFVNERPSDTPPSTGTTSADAPRVQTPVVEPPVAKAPDPSARPAPVPVAKAVSTAFDASATAPSGLGAMLNPVARPSVPPVTLTPPRPIPRPVRPTAPQREATPVSLSGLFGELRPSVGTPVIPPVDKSASVAGEVRTLTGASRSMARKTTEVFSQQETPIGVEVFGGKPGNPNQFSIPDASASGNVAGETEGGVAVQEAPAVLPYSAPMPVVPLKIRWSRLPVWFALMLLIPAGTWFALHSFFHESITQAGRLTYTGVGLQSPADLHDFHAKQIQLACSEDVRLRALQYAIKQGKPADFLADAEKYREFVQDKDFTPIDNSTLEFQLSYPGTREQGEMLITAIMTGLADRDQELETARSDARAAADTARADFDATRSQLDQLRADYHKAAAAAENFPDPVSVAQAIASRDDLKQKLDSVVAARSNTEALLAKVKSEDPSKPIDPENDSQIVDLKTRLQPLLDQIQIAKTRGGISTTSPSGAGTDVSVGATTQPDADPLLSALQTQADALQKKIQDRRDDLAVLAAIPAAQRVVDQTRQIEDLTVKLTTQKAAEDDLKTQLNTASDLANKNKALKEAAQAADARRQELSVQINDTETQLKIKSDAWQAKESAYSNCITVAPAVGSMKNPSVRYISITDLSTRFLLFISVLSWFFLGLLIWGELRRPRLLASTPATTPVAPPPPAWPQPKSAATLPGDQGPAVGF
jgi:pSer/pThr/pTyr-binding forkhead associated (FHA) protein